MAERKQKLSLDTAMNFLSVFLISLFTINPIIQFFYKVISGKNEWYPFREYYNYVVLGVGVVAFTFYIAYRFMKDRDVGIFGVQKRNIAFILLILFALLMIISTFVNKWETIFKTGLNNVAMIGTEYRNEGLLTYLSYLMYFLFAVFIADEKLKKIWLKVFGIVSSFVAILVVIDYFIPALQLETIYYAMEKSYAKTLFNNPNHTAYYILVSVFVCVLLFVKAKKLWEYILYGILSVFGTMALIIDDTLGCIVAYVGASLMTVLILGLSEKRFSIKFLSPLGFFGISFAFLMLISPALSNVISPNLTSVLDMWKGIYSIFSKGKLDESIISDKAGTGRVKLWNTASELIENRPWIGYSADGMAHKLQYYAGNDRCHNEYMNYALSFGIPCAVLYFASILTIYLRGLRNKAKLTDTQKIALIVAFAYCVSAFFGNTMFYTAPLLFIMLGFGYYRKAKE